MVNIWEILKERNKDLVAEIEKLRLEKNKSKKFALGRVNYK